MTETRRYLQDMLEHLNHIEAFMNPGREAFLEDIKTQFAVMRAYEVIGEIAKRIPLEVQTANPQIKWRTLAGFRDFLAHNYHRVILENILIAIEDLPDLKSAVKALLQTINDE